jgi:hypothetical protein
VVKIAERALFAALIGAGALALHQIAAVTFALHNWEFPKAGDWATWFGAAGTIAAFCVTIHIARTETRRREKQEIALARIAASKLWMLIPEILEIVKLTSKLLDRPVSAERESDWRNFGEALAAIEIWDDEDLVRLANGSRLAGAQLALAGAEVRLCAKKFKSHAITHDLLHFSERDKFDASMKIRLLRIQSYLRSGFDECDQILIDSLN